VICILQLGVYLSIPLLFQDEASGDDKTDVKPFLSFSVDGADVSQDDETDMKPFLSFSIDEAYVSQEMEECSTEETK
jgi:hypothetical protein